MIHAKRPQRAPQEAIATREPDTPGSREIGSEQKRGLRSGTQNVAGAVRAAIAIERGARRRDAVPLQSAAALLQFIAALPQTVAAIAANRKAEHNHIHGVHDGEQADEHSQVRRKDAQQNA